MTPPDPHLLGPLIAQARLARGWSQQRLAAELCAAAGVPTLTRHEVSRWERQARLPGGRWLARLAPVLGVPAELLAQAAARSRPPDAPRWPGGARSRAALLALAQRWSADPGAPLPGAPAAARPDPTAAEPAEEPAAAGPPDAAALARLRRLDDLTGGADLVPAAAGGLRRTARALAGAGPARRRRLLPVLAETAQLTGWLRADAGDRAGALDAYRLGLRAAATAGDRAFAGYVLASASHLLAEAGDAEGALLLARAGQLGARRAASPGLRALLRHRVALATALDGRPAAGRRALDAARGGNAVAAGAEPPWLYWLDEAELAAMTGRALVALGRPGPAVPLLHAGAERGRPRRAAIYGGWLARALLQLGEVEQACAVAEEALLDAVRAGSTRATASLAGLDRRLAAHRTEPAVRRYAALRADARPFLPPGPGTRGRPTRAGTAGPERRADQVVGRGR
ncbi:transcriptional regulator [Micromonospora sp. NPDC000089]|uniref:transcriptional regulator n=1 Tax=unclassified Micromonospora TaxID=2617518 RepID=UPI0036AD5E26